MAHIEPVVANGSFAVNADTAVAAVVHESETLI